MLLMQRKRDQLGPGGDWGEEERRFFTKVNFCGNLSVTFLMLIATGTEIYNFYCALSFLS